MKTKIATALSVVGVLAAGSAAALVNTQILDGGPAESGASAAVLPPAATIDVSIPEPTPPTTEPAPTTTEPTGSSVPANETATTMPATSEHLTAFNVGEAGVVTVDVVDGRLVLVSAEPKQGWTVSDAEEHDDDNQIEVEFRSATVRVEFEAALVDGRIVPEVESFPLGGAISAGGAASTTTVPDFDDDDRSDDVDSSGDDVDSDGSDGGDHDSDGSDGDDHDSSGDDVDSSGDDVDSDGSDGGDHDSSGSDDDESEDRDDD